MSLDGERAQRHGLRSACLLLFCALLACAAVAQSPASPASPAVPETAPIAATARGLVTPLTPEHAASFGSPQATPAPGPSTKAPSVAAPALGRGASSATEPPSEAASPRALPPIRTEEGELGGSSFRIDLPAATGNLDSSPGRGAAWNGILILFLHGYQQLPGLFAPNPATGKPNPPSRLLQPLLLRGYAIAQPGYSLGGWAVGNAQAEAEQLRSYFAKHYGNPRETYVVGQSMGGLLAVETLEQHPHAYAGGLALCGVLAPADLQMQRAFANRVAFDAFFPGILPDVEHIPDDFRMNDPTTATAVEKALDQHPAEAALLRSLADIHTNRGLADVLVFNTFVIKDLRLKAGGNPFDNRNLIYTGTTDDNALNNKVRRYEADPRALAWIGAHYSPTGELRRPLLALHTLYDPLVPAETAAYYDELTRRTGHGELFVQQYVVRDGHCNITPEQAGEAFDELVSWAHKGARPQPGRLPDPTQQKPAHEQPVPQPVPPKNVGKPE